MRNKSSYKNFLSDYERDTFFLSLMEHGAYRILLDAFYVRQEGRMPSDNDSLFRICRAFDEAERNAVLKVRDLFFRIGRDGQLRHAKTYRRPL